MVDSLSKLGLHPALTSVPATSWLCASRKVGNLSGTLTGVLLQASEAAQEAADRPCQTLLLSAQQGLAKALAAIPSSPWSCPRWWPQPPLSWSLSGSYPMASLR